MYPSKEDREKQIILLCNKTKYSFSGWVDGYKNSSSRFICKCDEHGEWETAIHNFVNNGRRCKGCQAKKTGNRCRTDEKDIISAINSINSKYSFVRWDNGYSSTKSKFVCSCSIHGEWSVTPLHFIYQKTGCPSCAGLKPYSRIEREEQISRCCKKEGLEFIGWIGDYKNSYSRFIYSCKHHGESESSVNSFVNSGCRCSGCNEYGFNTSNDGFLYSLVSDGGEFIKIGISNYPEDRLKRLEKNTPFGFSLVEMIPGSGSYVRMMERKFHKKYKSAGLSGFDGCTEWLLFDHSILDDLRNPVMIGNDKK